MLAETTHGKYRKNRKNNKSNKNQDLEKEEAKKGTEMSLNVAKNANIFVHNSWVRERSTHKCTILDQLLLAYTYK